MIGDFDWFLKAHYGTVKSRMSPVEYDSAFKYFLFLKENNLLSSFKSDFRFDRRHKPLY